MIFIYFWVPWSWVGAFTFFIVLCWSDLFHFPSSTFPASRLFVLLFALHSEWFTGKACLLEHRTHDQKVPGSNPGRSGRRIFFSRVNFVCWLLFGVCSTPMLPQWHVKDSGHSAKSAGGRLLLNMHTPLTQRSWSGLTMPLSRHSVGTYLEMSSHATCQGTFGDSHLSSLSHYGLILG